jgi:hypothetical protein
VPQRACCPTAEAIHWQQRGTGGSRQCRCQGTSAGGMQAFSCCAVLLAMRLFCSMTVLYPAV